MRLQRALSKTYWFISSQVGLDLRKTWLSLFGLPRFLADWVHFKRIYNGPSSLLPCLIDWFEEGGSIRNEYFGQDLYVAQKIYTAKPVRHIDIGSRIDGFVAHVASFREIEVFDIRPVTVKIPGIIFRQADFMNVDESLKEFCDSLSCLHALEHFGLGRYGDPINILGYVTGFRNMSRLLKSGGLLYLSVPIGLERVEFNAHRVFNPLTILRLAAENGLALEAFALGAVDGMVTELAGTEADFSALSRQKYNLGIFTFHKT